MPLWFGRQKNPCTGLGKPRGFQEVQASGISLQSAHECGEVVSATHRLPFTPQEILLVLICIRSGVDPRTIVRPEGLCKWKFQMTPLGIEPATFRLNQLRRHGSLFGRRSGAPRRKRVSFQIRQTKIVLTQQDIILRKIKATCFSTMQTLYEMFCNVLGSDCIHILKYVKLPVFSSTHCQWHVFLFLVASCQDQRDALFYMTWYPKASKLGDDEMCAGLRWTALYNFLQAYQSKRMISDDAMLTQINFWNIWLTDKVKWVTLQEPKRNFACVSANAWELFCSSACYGNLRSVPPL